MEIHEFPSIGKGVLSTVWYCMSVTTACMYVWMYIHGSDCNNRPWANQVKLLHEQRQLQLGTP